MNGGLHQYPGGLRGERYDARRRSTLNFESVGGERHGDFERAPELARELTPSTQFFERRYVVQSGTSTKGANDMAKNSHESNGDGDNGREYRYQRRERFECTGSISAVVTTRSGDVRVHASSGNEVTLTLGTNREGAEELLAGARVVFDERRQTLEIETRAHDSTRSGGLRAVLRGEFSAMMSNDLDVILAMPEGSDLQITTASGDSRVGLTLGEVKVTSASGDVVALDTTESLDVRTASGDVKAGRVLTRLRFKTASGELSVAQAARSTDVASASGDVDITTAVPGKLAVNSASGDVNVHVAVGLCVDVAGNTLSGRLASEIELGEGDSHQSDDEVSFIKVNTVSGDIVIERARS